MNIIAEKDIFNTNFKNNIGNRTNKSYINNLLHFALDNNYLSKNEIENNILDFQKAIEKYIRSTEDNKDVSSIKDKRIKTSKDIMYAVENNLLTMEPYDSLSSLLGDKEKLINDSVNYYSNKKKELLDKIEQIKKLTFLEYQSNRRYSEQLELLKYFVSERIPFKGLIYGPMIQGQIEVLTNESYLNLFEKYIDSFLKEANIISKFNDESRKYILRMHNKNDRDVLSDQQLDNICYTVLTNYVLLSVYSNNPEKLVVTKENFNILKNELLFGTIDAKELEEYILNGPIKFTKDEFEYIKESYIELSVDENRKAYKTLFIHMAI